MTAVLLALLTALSYGVANYLGPVLSRTYVLGGLLLVGQGVGMVGGAALLVLSGDAPPDRRHLLLGALGGVCNGLALATQYLASRVGPISIVAPIGATGSVVPVLVAVAGGERPAAVQVVGIPLAIVGVVLAAARDSAGAQRVAPRTLVLAAVSALSFGGFLAFFGAASTGGTHWAVFSSRTALVACTGCVLALRRQPVRLPLRAVPRVAVPGVLLLTGTVAYATASTQGLVSVVAVLVSLSTVVTVGLAVVVLGERLAVRQRIGVAVALLGVVLLASG